MPRVGRFNYAEGARASPGALRCSRTVAVRDGRRLMPSRLRPGGPREDFYQGGCSGWPHGSLRSTRAGPWVLAAREQSVNDPSDLIQIEGLLHAGGSRRREKAPLLRVQEVPGDEDQPTAELGEAPLEGAVKFDAVQHGHLRVGQNQVVASR